MKQERVSRGVVLNLKVQRPYMQWRVKRDTHRASDGHQRQEQHLPSPSLPQNANKGGPSSKRQVPSKFRLRFRREEKSQTCGNVIGASLGARTPCHSECSLSKGLRRDSALGEDSQDPQKCARDQLFGSTGGYPCQDMGKPRMGRNQRAYDSQAEWPR